MSIDIGKGIVDNDLATIYLDGVAFRGVGYDSVLGWSDFVWAEEPQRSLSFSFENMDEIDVGLVARCEFNFKYFKMSDYIKFRKIVKQRHFTANYFDRDLGYRVTRDMYCTSSELKRLYNFETRLLGVLDFTVKLVGTNRDLTTLGSDMTITYDANGGLGSIPAETVKWSEQYNINPCTAFTKSGYALASLNTKPDGSGWKYLPNQSITAFDNLTLYAQWVSG